MPRSSALITVSSLVAACAGSEPLAPAPPPPPAPGFVVFGTVQDEGGYPLPGVGARLINLDRQTTSNEGGYFSFTDVRGPVTLRITRAGFEPQLRNLVVTADLGLDLKMVRLMASDTIVLGSTIQSYVHESAPPCDPDGWDASAPCRRFLFRAPSAGVLLLEITWNGGVELDATVVDGYQSYVATSTEAGPGVIVVQAPVIAGETYEVRVNSYYGRQEFSLKATMNP